MTNASKARILVLGDTPTYQKEQWDAFCKRFEVIPADLSSRENFQQSLRDERCVDAPYNPERVRPTVADSARR